MLKYHLVLSKPLVIFFHSSTSKHHCTVVGADICSKKSLNFFQMKIFNIKVQLFWEGHKNFVQSSSRFWYNYIMSKPWGRLRQISVAFSKILTLISYITLYPLLCTYDIYSAFKIMYPITVQLYHVQLWVCRTGLTICIPIRKQSQSFCIIPMALLMPYCRSLHLASKLNLLLKENSYESSKF